MGGTLNVGHDQVIELLQVLLLVKIREDGRGGERKWVCRVNVKRKRWEGEEVRVRETGGKPTFHLTSLTAHPPQES